MLSRKYVDSVVERYFLTGLNSNAEKRKRFRSPMEWIGNMSKQIGFVAGMLVDTSTNDPVPTVMNINRCLPEYVCLIEN
jgi:hypothetical protein